MKLNAQLRNNILNFTVNILSISDLPKGEPEMTIEKGSRELGYPLRGNCTSSPSYPAVNLTWYLNDRKVSVVFIIINGFSKCTPN